MLNPNVQIDEEFIRANVDELADEAIEVLIDIKNMLMRSGVAEEEYVRQLVCYLLYVGKEKGVLGKASYSAVANGYLDDDELVTLAFKDCIGEELWNELRDYGNKRHPFILSRALLFRKIESDDGGTPEGVASLANRLMNISDGMSVADIGCGDGNYIFSLAEQYNNLELMGYDLDTYAVVAAKVCAKLREWYEGTIEIEQANVFAKINREGSERHFDRVFSNHPIATPVDQTPGFKSFQMRVRNNYPWVDSIDTADWAYNACIVDLLNQEGKAVGLMARGSARNAKTLEARRYFIESGLIECVINLPERILPGVTVELSLVVFSKGNESVRLVEASPYCELRRRHRVLDEAGVEKILQECRTDSSLSKLVNLEELRANSYSLDIWRYQKSVGLISADVQSLGELTSAIARGILCTAKELDDMSTTGIKNLRYLSTSSIENGFIDYSSLTSLRELRSSFVSRLAPSGSLIIPRNGDSSKIAVIDVPSDLLIVPSGNLYVVTIDSTLVDPYYVAAFLKSDEGKSLLAGRTAGTKAKSISIGDLKELPIPIVPFEKQECIVQRYKQSIDAITNAKTIIAGAVKSMESAFVL